MNLIVENNEDIDSLVKYLDKRIIELRRKNVLTTSDLSFLTKFYQETILPWMKEFYLPNKVVDKQDESEIINSILDVVNWLKKIL